MLNTLAKVQKQRLFVQEMSGVFAQVCVMYELKAVWLAAQRTPTVIRNTGWLAAQRTPTVIRNTGWLAPQRTPTVIRNNGWLAAQRTPTVIRNTDWLAPQRTPTVIRNTGWLAPQRTPTVIRNVSTSCPMYAQSRGVTKKKELSEKQLTRYFVDHRRVKLHAGAGGKGACTFHSEPRKEWGGPDGGNGGNGGNITLKVDRRVKSLAQVAPIYKGDDGEAGGSKNCYGRNADTTHIPVPLGTLVKEQGETVADLSQQGQEFVAVFGGAGGKGNRFFLSNENRAPMTATPGEKGQERVLQLELRTMAHAGLVGFPNAGKSSLLRAISNARPAVAAYPFTTLNPHVGIVKYRDHEQVAVADIPGIIRGAHLNRGLGISFLRHVERCRFLLFVLDMSSPEPWMQLQYLRYELDQYEPGLSRRPHAIVANKMDLPGSRVNLEALRDHVKQRVIPVSALTGLNAEELVLHLRELYDGYLQTPVLGGGGDKPTRW
ncbi:hypothetical protein DPEC_G00005120 [Dallia pectoralis]|uniref:Uncharacterized protein n=1 Tax=Dallia pectoralis TaxID=75939 RepID=A0ACC2HK63_DALPE|nr:hypothetical protein DPEC_G00005120 [Dallia pectoralis]